MKKLVGVLLLCCAIAISAQTPVVPTVTVQTLDLTTLNADSVKTGMDLQTFVQAENGNLNALQNGINAAVTAINDPASGNAALNARLKVVEAWIAAQQNPPAPPTSTTVDLTAFPIGPLNGADGNIQWNTGQWTATGQGVVPAVLGAARNFVLPANVTMTSIAVQFMTQTGSVRFTDAAGETFTSPSIAPGSVTVLNTGWVKASGAVAVSTPSSPATDLRLVNLSYK